MSGNLISLEKLEGSTNYCTWKIHMELLLITEDLWQYVLETPSAADTAGLLRDSKARARILLQVKPNCLIHARKAKTAKESWEALRSTFEDKGINNRCNLLGKLVSQKLSMYESPCQYVTAMMSIAQKLGDIGKEVDDELLAALMLQGLGDKYIPLRMAIENSNIVLTTDYVKAKLLQLDMKQGDEEEPSTSALVSTKTNFSKTRNDSKKPKKKMKCFICKEDHKAVNCPSNPTKKKTNYYRGQQEVNFTALSTIEDSRKGDWILDSGASSHMTHRKDWLQNYVELEKPVQVICANGSRINGEGRGDVCSARELEFTVSGAMYVPNLTTNLLSVSTLVKRDLVVVFSKRGCEIYSENDCEIKGSVRRVCKEERGIYKFKSNSCTYNSSFTAWNTIVDNNYRVWHQRLGHLSFGNMKLLRDKMAEGIDFKDPETVQCISCLKGKQTKISFPKKTAKRATDILGLIHSDVCGPIETPSFSGKRYFITFIDDKTRKTFVYFLREKSEVFSVLVDFKIFAETQTGKKLKIIRTDNGTEYVNKKVSEFLKQNGIIHQLTVDYTPAQNGVSERANRTIVERARSMLAEANLPKVFWAEAVQTSVFLKNRSPTLAVKGMTPEEAWNGRKVNLSFLRIFGCRAFMHIPDEKRKKFDPKSLELIFVGYCETTKGYRLMDATTRKIYKARDVVFFENQREIDASKSEIPVEVEEVTIPLENIREQDVPLNQSTPITSETPVTIQNENDTESREETESGVVDTNIEPEMENVIRERRYPLRKRTPTVFKDCISYHSATLARDEPLSVEEALSREDKEEWRKAIESELKSLKKNMTWELVENSKGSFVDSKWIFKIKKEPGEKFRYKARLVARGFTQVKGVNYNETFSPVVRHSTLRFLLAIAVEYNLQIDHMDVVTAFLNGDLTERVYMKQPKGFEEKGYENHVCLLRKALYGLKQAPRAWNEKLNKALLELGFKRTDNEPCVYMRKRTNSFMMIAVYVDDLLIFWDSEKEKNHIKTELQTKFEMKDLGKVDTFLGIKIKQEKGVIRVNQSEYLKKTIEKFGMANCKPVRTPMDTKLKLIKSKEVPSVGIPYRELIGSLMYLAVCTRPDIAYVVSYLSQFNNCYDQTHWLAAKRVLRYLSGSQSFELIFRKTGTPLFGYVDADHGGDVTDRKSYSGFVFVFAGGPISWESRKQRTIALSSAEAEYVALSEACREAIFLKNLCIELTDKEITSIRLLSDSQSAIRIADNPIHHNRTKHIDVRHHYIRDMVRSKTVLLDYVPTQEMMADVFTKGLARVKHELCMRGLGCGSTS